MPPRLREGVQPTKRRRIPEECGPASGVAAAEARWLRGQVRRGNGSWLQCIMFYRAVTQPLACMMPQSGAWDGEDQTDVKRTKDAFIVNLFFWV